ncbi:peptidoglycan DD-metalloendopeptidase family protein [Mesorhizobium sp. ZC-5]|uniref:peptidoglycan DD-metalloendopeptidase family protein n=1 Tax=Mesorhizobium sp. ZC-5 TaxID=2986066 RepID=UPI0021E77817|nr:peptidoglycan DD-metalloendopeptidase family protein [Mesorhizobium sp. ZC-5]MCV3243518.1 peptidoglycan DD-metalloendopeptidase family protein [Mesorhizobium sp. ZC-5]
MRLSQLNKSQRILARSAAILLVGGLAAGCSSGAARFGGVDDIFTSTTNQRQIIPPASQPYPAGQAAQVDTSAANRQAVQPVDVSRSPVGRSTLPPVAGTQVASSQQPVMAPVATQPVRSPSPTLAPVASAPAVDDTVTGTVKQPAPAAQAAGEDIKGWSRAGGSQVTAKEGETVYNLSRRFGVPADVIMKANGLNQSAGLQAGQKVIIPTYVYSDKAGVSAPDSNPNVAEAKSSRGTKYDVPAHKVPLPSGAPTDKVAVLPQPPKVKEGEAAQPLAATAPTAKNADAPGTYKVQEGDTLSRIARKTGVGVAALKQANGLQDGLIRVGQTLTVPAAGAAQVAAAAPAKVDKVTTGATDPNAKAETATYTPPKKAEKVMEQAEQDTAAAPDATGIGRMRWPVRGRVISGYGAGGGKNGDGIDIAVPEGTPVKAAENGVVIYAGDGLKEFGNTVLVRHENGLVTVYGHASALKVARGEKVKRGQEIATSGMSGTTDRPKLHFEVRKNSAPVDPKTFLE